MKTVDEKTLLTCIYCSRKITPEASMEFLGDGLGTCHSCGKRMDNYQAENPDENR